MNAARMPRHAGAPRRVFTLLEAVVVLAIIGILSAIAVVGYNGVRRGQMDAAGQPVIGAALVDGRRVAAISEQTFPASIAFLAGMNDRATDVNGSNVTYTLEGSKDPGVVAVLRGDPNTGGYAVATSVGTGSYAGGDAADVNCLFAVDSLVNGTTYAKMKMVTDLAQTGCVPMLRFFCPGDPPLPGNGTAESPWDLGTTRPPAFCVGVPLEPLDAPLCVVAQPLDAGAGTSSALLSWVPGASADLTASYTAVLSPPVAPSAPSIPTSARHATLTGLVPGTTYTVGLFAVDAAGLQYGPSPSNSFVAAPAGPPALAAVASIVAGTPHMSLSWSAAPGAATYTVTRTPAFAAPLTLNMAALPYDDHDGLAPGAAYTYVVTANPPAVTPTPIRCGLPVTTPAGGTTSVVGLTRPAPPDLSEYATAAAPQTYVVTWTASPTATSYELYNCAAAQLVAGVCTSGNGTLLYNGADRTFSDTDSGPGGRTAYGAPVTYYGVYAHNASGDSLVSNTWAAQPPEMQLPTLTAYPNGYGSSYLAWPATPGALRYGVFRSASAGGAYTLLNTVTVLTYTDATPVLGSTWYYKVTAYFTADPTPATSSAVNSVQQFPAVPVTAGFAARGSGVTSGNVVDGTNHVAWAASAGSASYQLYVSQGGAASLVAATAVLAYDHGGQALGSRADYFAVGVNACHDDPADPLFGTSCLSPNKPGGTVAPAPVSIYQRPAAPALSVNIAPTLATNFTRLLFARNGDAGSPAAAKFCDTPGLCTYTLARSLDGTPWVGTTWTPYYGSGVYTLDPSVSDANNSGWWGRTADWTVATWNPGGWSNYAVAARARTYPSPFAVTAATLVPGYKFSTTAGLSGSRYYTRDLTWGTSYGVGMYYWYRPYPTAAWVATGAGLSTPTDRTFAGTVYAYTIQAQSDNGLIRQIGYTVQTAPATLRHIQARWQCLESNDTWRIRYDSVDSRPLYGLAADQAYYDLLPSPANGGTNNSGTDGVHALLVLTAFTPNTIQTGWASGAMPNIIGYGQYMTFENRLNLRAGSHGSLYSVALALGTNRSASALFTGCGGSSSAWQYVDAVKANYPDGSVPRTLTASSP